jgi:hypothetical protein
VDSDSVAKWIWGLLASILGVAAAAGGLWARVGRDSKDIQRLDDECGADRGLVQQELQKLGNAVTRLETKLNLLLEHNGLGKKRKGGE